MQQHRPQESVSNRKSPRRFPVIGENIPVHLHSPALIPLPLVLDESHVLSSSLYLSLSQTGEVVIVKLSHRSHRKLSFELKESTSLNRLNVAARLLCLFDASLLGRALGCLLIEVRCRTLLSQRCFPACLCGEVSYAVRFDATGGRAGNDRRGGEEDHAAEIITLVALADFEWDGEVRLVGENIGLDRRTLPI
jgi:hypothetical protein